MSSSAAPSGLAVLLFGVLPLLALAVVFGLVLRLVNRKAWPAALGLLAVPLMVVVALGLLYFTVMVRNVDMARREFGRSHPRPTPVEIPTPRMVPVPEVIEGIPVPYDDVHSKGKRDANQVAAVLKSDEIRSKVAQAESEIRSVLSVLTKAVLTAMAEDDQDEAEAPEQATVEAPPTVAEQDELPLEPECPAWVDAEPDRHGSDYHMPIALGPYTTRSECDRYLDGALTSAVQKYVATHVGPRASGRVRFSPDFLEERILKEQYEEWNDYSVGRMVTLHALLVFDRQMNTRLQEDWKRIVINERLWRVSALALPFLLLLSAVYAYLRIDLATAGSYRGRLRLAAGAVILTLIAAGFMAVNFVRELL